MMALNCFATYQQIVYAGVLRPVAFSLFYLRRHRKISSAYRMLLAIPDGDINWRMISATCGRRSRIQDRSCSGSLWGCAVRAQRGRCGNLTCQESGFWGFYDSHLPLILSLILLFLCMSFRGASHQLDGMLISVFESTRECHCGGPWRVGAKFRKAPNGWNVTCIDADT